MVITVRLDEQMREVLDQIARSKGISRSEVIRQGIELVAHEEGLDRNPTPIIAKIDHLVGSVRSGGTLSERTGDRFREIARKRRNR